jgi:Peroxidase, family 2
MFVTALTSTYNLDPAFATQLASGAISALAKPGASSIDLSDLNKHDVIEHDASLTRKDISQGDNFNVQPALVQALLEDAKGTGYITVDSLARTRSRREADSKAAGSPGLGAKALTLAYGETGLLLQALGHLEGSGEKPRGWAAPVDAVKTWIGDERLPKGYKAPPKQISTGSTGLIATEVTAARAAGGAASFLTGLLGGRFH